MSYVGSRNWNLDTSCVRIRDKTESKGSRGWDKFSDYIYSFYTWGYFKQNRKRFL